ncbi:DeoR/GlpR family DNA-binding transcription regulator [Streptococcus sp. DD13]|uniref:DeoR/GlpR family DNA-binding transcription regulator n=1 Tax=Streptococcus sp. DD13 TaxID=1777881 RepID=UPI00079807DF|nr:DeoR/GlpR family DNA-binding transcription regulator [Streptococcus sp. DD13]KXT78334.1 Lactose phosphotransferase system repressor [Streptococcus sp. DD13]
MKESRHVAILQELDKHGVVSVKSLKDMLGVTDMTVRRDLIELEEQDLLVRVHGGAHRKVKNSISEALRTEKHMVHMEEKQEIAQKCAQMVNDGDTIFIGSGTTTDYIGDFLNGQKISIVTNSLPIFEKLKDVANYDVILIGGRYRVKTQTFVGQFANRLLNDIKVNKAFIGTNGLDGNTVSTANEEEGMGERIILDNAIEKYIVADHSKFDQYSFYSFYDIDQLTAVITDSAITEDVKAKYQTLTTIL